MESRNYFKILQDLLCLIEESNRLILNRSLLKKVINALCYTKFGEDKGTI